MAGRGLLIPGLESETNLSFLSNVNVHVRTFLEEGEFRTTLAGDLTRGE